MDKLRSYEVRLRGTEDYLRKLDFILKHASSGYLTPETIHEKIGEFLTVCNIAYGGDTAIFQSLYDAWKQCDIYDPTYGMTMQEIVKLAQNFLRDPVVRKRQRHASDIPERHPIQNEGRPVWEIVIEDMKARDNAGRLKYGTPLQAGNGRNALWDAYQEALDLAVYLRQEILEKEMRNESNEH